VESRYVTLDEIALMIKGGAEVKIVDNRSKEDLTSVTLAQIIFEEEKKRSQMPLGVLREIIRHGGEAVAGFYAEKAGTIVGKLGELRNKTESIREDLEQRVRGVTGIFRKEGEGSSPVKDVMAAGERAVGDLRGRGGDGLPLRFDVADARDGHTYEVHGARPDAPLAAEARVGSVAVRLEPGNWEELPVVCAFTGDASPEDVEELADLIRGFAALGWY